MAFIKPKDKYGHPIEIGMNVATKHGWFRPVVGYITIHEGTPYQETGVLLSYPQDTAPLRFQFGYRPYAYRPRICRIIDLEKEFEIEKLMGWD